MLVSIPGARGTPEGLTGRGTRHTRRRTQPARGSRELGVAADGKTRKVSDSWRQVTDRARCQLSLVSGDDLDAIGVSPTLRTSWIRHGRLSSERRNVYRVCGTPRTWRSAVLAAVLASGPPAVASHLTAAALHGLGPTLKEAASPIRLSGWPLHLTAPRQIRMHGVICHQRRLLGEERTVIDAVPVASIERTLLDLSDLLDVAVLGRCVDEAVRRGARLERVRQSTARLSGPGRLRRWPIHEVLAARLPGFDPGANACEREMDDRWDALGLPAAERQYAVAVGGQCYVLDRAIPELRIGIEWTGFSYHGRRSNFDRDSYRRADLIAAGWELVEVTSTWTAQRLCRVVAAVVERRQGLSEAGCTSTGSGDASPLR